MKCCNNSEYVVIQIEDFIESMESYVLKCLVRNLEGYAICISNLGNWVNSSFSLNHRLRETIVANPFCSENLLLQDTKFNLFSLYKEFLQIYNFTFACFGQIPRRLLLMIFSSDNGTIIY